jgi:amino acid permease
MTATGTVGKVSTKERAPIKGVGTVGRVVHGAFAFVACFYGSVSLGITTGRLFGRLFGRQRGLRR